MREAAQTWTLSFRDAALERGFRADMARRALGQYRAIIAVSLVTWVGIFPFDPAVGGSGDNIATLRSVRFGFTPVLVALLALSWLPPHRYERLWQPALCAGACILLALVTGTIPLLPDPGRYSIAFQPAGFILIVGVLYTGFPIRVLYVAIPATIATGGMIWVLAVYSSDAAIYIPVLLVCNVMGVAANMMLEQYRRRAYLYASLLDAERAKSDALLHNMVPASIANQLKNSSEPIAEHHDAATVLFADIVGFTPMSEAMTAQETVTLLDGLFTQFDAKVDELGLEKIKTIGDAYMAVGGVPTARDDHARAVAELALALRDIVARVPPAGATKLAMRIGMHSGPLVAGVIGTRKLVYDLWGDTVNTASRMESHAEDGTIQLTAATAEHLSEDYVIEERGQIEVKGKGPMTTYVLAGRRAPTASP